MNGHEPKRQTMETKGDNDSCTFSQLTQQTASRHAPGPKQFTRQRANIVSPTRRNSRASSLSGREGGTQFLQNAAPIPILTTSYTFAGAPSLSGDQADTGQ
jgi:hypothetical protein